MRNNVAASIACDRIGQHHRTYASWIRSECGLPVEGGLFQLPDWKVWVLVVVPAVVGGLEAKADRGRINQNDNIAVGRHRILGRGKRIAAISQLFRSQQWLLGPGRGAGEGHLRKSTRRWRAITGFERLRHQRPCALGLYYYGFLSSLCERGFGLSANIEFNQLFNNQRERFRNYVCQNVHVVD